MDQEEAEQHQAQAAAVGLAVKMDMTEIIPDQGTQAAHTAAAVADQPEAMVAQAKDELVAFALSGAQVAPFLQLTRGTSDVHPN